MTKPGTPFLQHMKLYEDDRGSVYCAMDYMGSIDEGGRDIKRTYVVRNWSKGMIRAWHGHKKAWTGIHVIKGVAKLVGRNMVDQTEMVMKVVSDRKPGVFWIPPGWYNGVMSLEDDTRLLVYSTLTFEEVKSDDFRRQLTDMDKYNIFRVIER